MDNKKEFAEHLEGLKRDLNLLGRNKKVALPRHKELELVDDLEKRVSVMLKLLNEE